MVQRHGKIIGFGIGIYHHKDRFALGHGQTPEAQLFMGDEGLPVIPGPEGRLLPAKLGKPGPEGWQIETLVRATNARPDSAHDRYEIAPAELVEIAQKARSRGLEIAGFYHSHPDHPAQWSATDFAEAHWLGASYVITEVAHGKAAATCAFLLAGTSEEDKRFAAQEIRIENV